MYSGRGVTEMGGACVTAGSSFFGCGSVLKEKRKSLWGKGQNFAWGPGFLEIGRRWEGVLEEEINLKSGPIRDANPVVPPPNPAPHCSSPLLLIGSDFSARQMSSPLNRGFTKAQKPG